MEMLMNCISTVNKTKKKKAFILSKSFLIFCLSNTSIFRFKLSKNLCFSLI